MLAIDVSILITTVNIFIVQILAQLEYRNWNVSFLLDRNYCWSIKLSDCDFDIGAARSIIYQNREKFHGTGCRINQEQPKRSQNI